MSSNRATLIKKLQAEFRGILLSAGKLGLPLRELTRDYEDLNGRPIPLHELGYCDIMELLGNDMQDVCSLWQDKSGEITLFPVSHESTRHIEKLIARQRVHKASRFGGAIQNAPSRGRGGRSQPQPQQRTGYKQYNDPTANRQSTSAATAVPQRVPSNTSVSSRNKGMPPTARFQASNIGQPMSTVPQTNFQPTVFQSVPQPTPAVVQVIHQTNKTPSNFLLAPVAQTTCSIAVTTDGASAYSSSANFIDSDPLWRHIMQPRFTAQPITVKTPIVHNALSSNVTFPTPFVNQPSRQPTPTPFSSRPTLPNNIIRPVPFTPTPSQVPTTVVVTVSTTTTSTVSATQRLTIASISPKEPSKVENRSTNCKAPLTNKELYLEVKENVKTLIDKHARRGIDVSIFKSAYEDTFKKRINPKELFDMSWKELLSGMDDVCYVNEFDVVKQCKAVSKNGLRSVNSPPCFTQVSPSGVTNVKPNDNINKWLHESAEAVIDDSNDVSNLPSTNQTNSFINVSVPSPFDQIDWEDELEAMPDDSSDTSELSSHVDAAAAEVDDTSFLLPDLETEVLLVNRARAMVADGKATADSLQIIRTVVAMRRSALYKQMTLQGSDMPSNIVDKINWLEEQIRFFDDQTFEPEEPF